MHAQHLYDLAAVILVFAGALLLGEMQVRQEAGLRWCCLALIWVICVGLDIYVLSG